MSYIIDYDVCALLVSIITMIYFFGGPRLHDRQDRLYGMVGCCVVAASSANILATLTDGHVPLWAMTATHLGYLLFLFTLPVLMLTYMGQLAGRHIGRLGRVAVMLPYVMTLALLLTSPLTGKIFTVTGGVYRKGPLMPLLYYSAYFYILFALVLMATACRFVSGRKQWTICLFVGLLITAITLQYFFPRYLLVDLAAALTLMTMYVAMHSSGAITDPLTQVYNNAALTSLMEEHFSNKEHFYLVGYKLSGLTRINEVYGDAYGNGLLCHVARELQETVGGRVARISGDEFCVLIMGRRSARELVAQAEKMPGVWQNADYEVSYDAFKVILSSSDYATRSEMLEMLNFAFRRARNLSDDRAIIIDQHIKEQYYRWNRIHEAVMDALAKNRISVHYQPIISTATGQIIAAEALCRITDPELGMISPGEFIPVAEQSGLISQVDDRVRTIVWDFLRTYDIRMAGIDHISVNLSAVECTQPSIIRTIEEEAEEAGVERGTLHFEITETMAITSRGTLAELMERMQRMGYCFHLDDYGTDYAGITNLISLPFSVVKLDKSILNLAESTEKGKMVKSMIAPFHDCQIKVVCEGVETPEQEAMMHAWGVDFLQGYLYSKPLPAEKFVSFAGIPRRCRNKARAY